MIRCLFANGDKDVAGCSFASLGPLTKLEARQRAAKREDDLEDQISELQTAVKRTNDAKDQSAFRARQVKHKWHRRPACSKQRVQTVRATAL